MALGSPPSGWSFFSCRSRRPRRYSISRNWAEPKPEAGWRRLAKPQKVRRGHGGQDVEEIDGAEERLRRAAEARVPAQQGMVELLLLAEARREGGGHVVVARRAEPGQRAGHGRVSRGAAIDHRCRLRPLRPVEGDDRGIGHPAGELRVLEGQPAMERVRLAHHRGHLVQDQREPDLEGLVRADEEDLVVHPVRARRPVVPGPPAGRLLGPLARRDAGRRRVREIERLHDLEVADVVAVRQRAGHGRPPTRM